MQRYTSKVFGHKTTITSDHNNVIAHFSSASISVRAQKTIASKLSTRNTTKLLLNDSVDRLFNHLYAILKSHYSKKDAEKVVKNMIKIAVKLAVLSHNDLLEEQEAKQLVQLQKQLHSLALTTISFSQVLYSYERTFFMDLLQSIRQSLEPLVILNLSDKSSRRLSHIFSHLMNIKFMDNLFKADGPQALLLTDLSRDLSTLLESNDI